jgi:CRISPR-associated endonuclease/helicase Cas3
VDLDADLMITELAPTDMLLQRLGRLWRHNRSDRCAYVKRPIVYIIEENKSIEELMSLQPKKIISALGGKAHVYHPYVLLRTLQVWKECDQKEIAIPGQIRELLESTYMESVDDPDHWEKLFYEKFVQDSNERFIATMNSNYWQLQLPDEEGVQTRLNDFPTVPVVLCKKNSDKEIHFIDNTTSAFEKNKFLLSTGQAIHKNIVKVPLYCFETISPVQEFSIYLHGSQSVGVVDENNNVKLKGLKDGFNLYYTDELGLVIDKPSDKENI